MMNLFKLFAKKDSIKMAKTDSGEWIVKKNLKILYIGSKEKCQTYMNQLRMA
ncbi:hypothetical protein SAMN05421640_3144 [Ekhidna lutea]|uniref:Uncharacterized protein n=1 Tax=Ekhidna lutea TaxID=447679 RepID=A0A239LC34_EKHLU|nr:hypothetical protein [Ekhidna lutea]SNT28031.1 hypothetical protein SAMN05421640_3144 [Ekhidna lutea]